MKFEPLANYLEENNITLSKAAEKVGRTPTTIASWRDGNGIADQKVQKRIAKLMGVTIEEVQNEVFNHLRKEHCSQRVKDFKSLQSLCDDFIDSLSIATDGTGNPLSNELKNVIKKNIDAIRLLERI